MAFTKIKNSDFNDTGALNMPNRPSETISAQNIKKMFDAPAKEVITPAFNQLIDDLEDTTAAASIGAVAPVGARGNTVQAILNGVYGAISTAVVDVSEIKAEISSVIIQVDALEDEAHTHSNKELLDTYEQSESDLADAVTKKHAHSNKSLLDTYTQTNDNLADAVSKKHSHDNQSLLDTYEQTESNLADAVSKKHSHSNKSVLDKFGESSGEPTYDGSPISGAVDSVNGKTGTVVLTASDVSALPDSTEIPDSLSDLSDDSTHRLVTDTEKSTWNGKSTVSVTQVQTTGTKIATVTVDGTGTDLYAPTGGGGGSVNNAYKNVKVGSTTITASGEDTLELVAGSNVTLTPDATNKKVTIASSGGGSSTGDMLASDYDSDYTVKNANGIKAYVQSQIAGLMVKNTYDSDSAVANAGGIKAYVNSQISAQITSALTASY